MKRVVVTGFGLVTPLGCQVERVWERLCNGESGIRTISNPELCVFRSTIAGECQEFSTEPYMPVAESRRLDRFVQYAIVAAIDAVRMSGLNFEQEDRRRCAVIVGTGVGGLAEIEVQYQRLIDKGPSKVSPFTIPKIMPNAASGNISIYYGLLGPTYSVGSACASASNAVAESFEMIGRGDADVVITGGTEAALTKLGLSGFCAMRALSERNEEPEKASRPFDKERDGFVLSEGAGILVLESLEHAQSRGAEILAEIRGIGLSSDAVHITQPDPEGHNAAFAMSQALERSQINPDQVDYINAHGTSTHLGDIAETNAIKRAFGDLSRTVSISSTKSQIGHLLGGSASVALIFSILTIRDGIIPPTINLDIPDPECDLDYTPNVARERKCDIALMNSFGFGGHNSCIVTSRFTS
ncbi:MAG: beta-ketoacyl-ACP synthase II [Thermoguttaceae bacterium]